MPKIKETITNYIFLVLEHAPITCDMRAYGIGSERWQDFVGVFIPHDLANDQSKFDTQKL